MIQPANGSPAILGCRWILFRKRSDFLHATRATQALCVRISDAPRIVSEKDCHGCPRWEPAPTRES